MWIIKETLRTWDDLRKCPRIFPKSLLLSWLDNLLTTEHLLNNLTCKSLEMKVKDSVFFCAEENCWLLSTWSLWASISSSLCWLSSLWVIKLRHLNLMIRRPSGKSVSVFYWTNSKIIKRLSAFGIGGALGVVSITSQARPLKYFPI